MDTNSGGLPPTDPHGYIAGAQLALDVTISIGIAIIVTWIIHLIFD